MTSVTKRREFLKATAAVGAGFWVAGPLQAHQSKSPNERIAFAVVGATARGARNAADAAGSGDVVALCDVDAGRLDQAGNTYPKARKYADFRKLLEDGGKGIDAVVISTPYQAHAPAGIMAMRLGKHCFLEKPLTRTVYESRLVGEVARETGVATMMGNQGTALNEVRRSAAVLRAGRLGKVSEIHVWSNRPIWPQGGERAAPQDAPAQLDWNLWIGPRPMRPYAPGYHPFAWRGWWDFGGGALASMGNHTMNMAYMGLDLRDPITLQAETPGHNGDSLPKWTVITYEFAANDWRPGLRMTWYDGGKLPDASLFQGEAPATSGCLVIGSKGKLYSPGDYGERPTKFWGDVDVSGIEFVESPGHFQEWVRAIRGGEPAMSNFADYAAPQTEMMLAGNLAVWAANKPGVGPKLEWDAKNQKVTNVSVPGLEELIKPACRPGWAL